MKVIVRWQQVTGGHAMYEEGRRLYTGEINAAVRGAKAAGATEIVVMDCHGAGEGWTFNSLLPEELDPNCEYVVQNDRSILEFLDSDYTFLNGRLARHYGVENVNGLDFQKVK